MIIYKKGLSFQNARFLKSLGFKVRIFYLNKNGNRLSRCYRKISV